MPVAWAKSFLDIWVVAFCSCTPSLNDAMQIIPIDNKGKLQEAFDVRIDEMNVLDLKFLDDCDEPTLAVLFEDPKSERHIKTYVVDAKPTVKASFLLARWKARSPR